MAATSVKRLHRRIDLKRSTSSLGIVERIEYDPNRTSRIALVRWTQGVQLGCQKKCNTIEKLAPQPPKIIEPTTATIRKPFSFASLTGKMGQRKETSFSLGSMATYATVNLPTTMSMPPPGSKGSFISKLTCAKDVFFSALSSPRANEETTAPLSSIGSSFGFPRIAVAGAKPTYFAPVMREKIIGKSKFSLCEIRKWSTPTLPHRILRPHKIKRKAAPLSWHGVRERETLGVVGAAEHSKLKPKTGKVGERTKDGACKGDRAHVTYIIASHQLEPGNMVMNYDSNVYQG